MRKEIAALIVIFMIIIAGSFCFSRWGGKPQVEMIPNRSTYNSAPTGCKAFYLLLQEMGFETDRWQLPMKKLGSAAKPAKILLVMINPRPSHGACCKCCGSCSPKSENILSWVRNGGNLFIIDDRSNEVLEAMEMKIEKTREIWDGEKQILFPILPTAHMRKVRAIKIEGDAHLTGNIPAEAILHLKNKTGPVLTSFNLGEGQLTILTTPYAVSNRGISKEDNVILLTNIIVKEGNGRKILIDEYHHGYDSSLSLIGYYRGTPVFWVSLQILLMAVVLFYSLSRPFGKPKPLVKEKDRSIMEHVKAMASLYSQAGHNKPVLRNIYHRYRKLWIKRFGLNPNVDAEELCSLISERTGLKREKLMNTILKCEGVSNNEKDPDNAETLQLIRNLETYRRKIHGQC